MNNIYTMVKSGMIMPMHSATGVPGSQPHEEGGKHGLENVKSLGGYEGISNTLLGAAATYHLVRLLAGLYRIANASTSVNTVVPVTSRPNTYPAVASVTSRPNTYPATVPFISRNNTLSSVVPMYSRQNIRPALYIKRTPTQHKKNLYPDRSLRNELINIQQEMLTDLLADFKKDELTPKKRRWAFELPDVSAIIALATNKS